MDTEFEAMFGNIAPDLMRETLRKNNATLQRPEFLQRRYVFELPTPHAGHWLRIRDNGKEVTLTYKETGTKIHERKEIEISVSSFEKTVELMQSIGCKPTSFQESKREAWLLEFAEITIDTWPHLPPLLEVEAQSAAEVERISLLLGLDFNTAIFESVNALYKQTYGKTIEDVSKNGFFSLAFNSANPFK